jgi:hypothetical protein
MIYGDKISEDLLACLSSNGLEIQIGENLYESPSPSSSSSISLFSSPSDNSGSAIANFHIPTSSLNASILK